jgi:transposase InsO family protein
MDRDGSFCEAFRAVLKSVDVEPVRLPPRSPDLNAHLERFHRSIKSECLEKMIFFGETMLRNSIREYLSHYHRERNHQGLGNRIITPGEEVGRIAGQIQCREQLGGLLKYYHRDAA